MPEHSKLVKMRIENIGCIGPEGLEIELNNILTIVGANNTGKSTILKAYEFALGTETFKITDRCQRALDQVSSVEIWVHIPVGMSNIAEKWKTKDGPYLVVRSKWEWDRDFIKTRKTWDPEINDYAIDDTASGLDNVFNSRLPQPLRIGTLEDPSLEHQNLLKLILQPITDKLKLLMQTEDSDLNKLKQSFKTTAQKPVAEEEKNINRISSDINKSHNEIFPNLAIRLDVGLGDIEIDVIKLLLNNSRIMFKDWGDEVDWNKQGTGSQRALFWSIMQVRSKLKKVTDLIESNKKEIASLEKQLVKLEKEKETKKKPETIQKYETDIINIKDRIASLKKIEPEKVIEENAKEFSLPGYMLLIDEPEVGLHPNAIRAASKYLYTLGLDPSWQVIIATHSPQFVNPLQDHTTIVRLERTEKNLTPRTYRSDNVNFSEDEKENLKILNRFDQSIAEMFFGQKPIIIEGDTEYAAFEYLMNNTSEEYPISLRPVLIRARGKDTINLIIKILTNFKVSFSVLHDSDFETKGVAWSANERIHSSIQIAREAGCKVIHCVSLPSFELQHLPLKYDKEKRIKEPPEKDKPWNFLIEMKSLDSVKDSVKKVLDDLLSCSPTDETLDGGFVNELTNKVKKWTQDHCPQDSRFEITKE